uniref:GSDH domain-containing protein n=1 Tax=Caenorhabditis tropicalis TaxID=1561998 RepID=A0A1I7T7B7_9PELO
MGDFVKSDLPNGWNFPVLLDDSWFAAPEFEVEIRTNGHIYAGIMDLGGDGKDVNGNDSFGGGSDEQGGEDNGDERDADREGEKEHEEWGDAGKEVLKKVKDPTGNRTDGLLAERFLPHLFTTRPRRLNYLGPRKVMRRVREWETQVVLVVPGP